MNRSPRNRRSGYVLVMTLVLISLSAIMLAGFARHSLQLALAASRAQDELQLRWGAVSCRHAVLDQADTIFDTHAKTAGGSALPWPQPAVLSTTVQLGNVTFALALADEDAKLNLNTLHADPHARNRIAATMRQLGVADSDSDLPIRLRPFPAISGQPSIVYASWGQVFSLEHGGSATAHRLWQSTHQITCWGSGRLNVVRASDDAIRSAARLAVDDETVEQLLEQRKTTGRLSIRAERPSAAESDVSPGATSNSSSDLSPRARSQAPSHPLHGLLSDKSQCYSLWVAMASHQATRHALFVVNTANHRTYTFLW